MCRTTPTHCNAATLTCNAATLTCNAATLTFNAAHPYAQPSCRVFPLCHVIWLAGWLGTPERVCRWSAARCWAPAVSPTGRIIQSACAPHTTPLLSPGVGVLGIPKPGLFCRFPAIVQSTSHSAPLERHAHLSSSYPACSCAPSYLQ
ncbi:hypothetical protein Hypma_003627 [Hypsizygus marmoreus]|uniref:Uncharacterized protein n=1 Tax=Hypsizygus marmoreus TaxID=39966 RepID=A0A369J5D8_HYPMA|nr:hypothetical protein Hypma_003627 [Hypsizygus marmoreus]